MHSSKNDAEALYWQFRVELRGVFDIQLAQMELDRLGGRRIPKRQKLAEVCEKYCPQKAIILTEDKEGVQVCTELVPLETEQNQCFATMLKIEVGSFRDSTESVFCTDIKS